ncbi:MAG: hypothetical protein OXC29_02480, partial [Rhodococcus sp.]|nr:hypothetical protein [Rhodococcus sp. (in: high G+C Gram-positive bacteria)]
MVGVPVREADVVGTRDGTVTVPGTVGGIPGSGGRPGISGMDGMFRLVVMIGGTSTVVVVVPFGPGVVVV